MKSFAAFDQVLNARALPPAPDREVGGTGAAGDFQPLFAAGALGAASGDGAAASGHESPQIEVIEANGRVQQIVVTCRCGERTVLDCAY